MDTKLIYLASPYTAKTQAERELRYQLAVHATACLLAKGYRVFSPIAYTHPIDQYLAIPSDVWYEMDHVYLQRCDVLWVLTLPGWAQSKGIQHEIDMATQLGKPVQYISYEEAVGP